MPDLAAVILAAVAVSLGYIVFAGWWLGGRECGPDCECRR